MDHSPSFPSRRTVLGAALAVPALRAAAGPVPVPRPVRARPAGAVAEQAVTTSLPHNPLIGVV